MIRSPRAHKTGLTKLCPIGPLACKLFMTVLQYCFQFLRAAESLKKKKKAENEEVDNFQAKKKVYSEIVAKSVIVNKTGTKS